MLEELKNLNYHGGKDGLLFFIRNVIGNRRIKIRDAKVICSHALGRYSLSVDDLVDYCHIFGWVEISDDVLSISPEIATMLDDNDDLNETLIFSTVNQLFKDNIFKADMFFYDAIQCCYGFKNELLPLSLSCVRNVLISQGFFLPDRVSTVTCFYISSAYEKVVANYCRISRKQLSLENLKKQIENNEIAGEKAELFVLSYEKKRIGQPLCERIKRISEIDVTAGYDIVSFNSINSQEPDRFIEVKAVSSSGFYWSKNEYEIAKLKGNMYYLYLVELSKVNDLDYSPEIIRDPAISVMKSNSWFVEAQSYHIKRV